MNFDEYIRQSEPLEREKGIAWQTAIGLQQVDGLNTSDYLIDTARQHIEGDITIEQVKEQIDNYYKKSNQINPDESRTEEADKVAVKIAEILSEESFNFSVVEYITIHKRLFDGIYEFAGVIRDYNISKKEWVLDGESVTYGNATSLKETIEYDLTQEKRFDYRNIGEQEIVKHIAKFVSDLWQIHPFGEGNTRTTALFAIKYLRTLGFDVNNDAFAKHAWYFRNALVRANYNNVRKGIFATSEYLEQFFSNLLSGAQNELKNRNIHITMSSTMPSDTVNDIVNIILEAIKKDSKITLDGLALVTNKSKSTVARHIKQLKEQGTISRVGSDKTGNWEINK